MGDPTRFLGALAQLFARCRDEDVSPGAYVGHAERLSAAAVALGAGASGGKAEEDGAAAAAAAETARRQAELAGAYARYTTLLREHGAIDFGTRSRWRSSCARSAATRDSLQNRYRYILVDEFQDTNRAQSGSSRFSRSATAT